MMRRRRPSKRSDEATKSIPIDSDDQKRLIEQVASEIHQQDIVINGAFVICCYGSAMLSILGTAFVLGLGESHSVWVWLHAIIASALHISSSRIGTIIDEDKPVNLTARLFAPLIASLLVASCALWHFRQGTTVNEWCLRLPYLQATGNLLTALGSLLLRSESTSLKTSLKDLDTSRYAHKTL